MEEELHEVERTRAPDVDRGKVKKKFKGGIRTRHSCYKHEISYEHAIVNSDAHKPGTGTVRGKNAGEGTLIVQELSRYKAGDVTIGGKRGK